MKTQTAILAGLVLLAGTTRALGGLMEVPLPRVIVESDLIAICEIVEAEAPRKVTLQAPGWTQPIEGWWLRTYKVRVNKVLRNQHKAVSSKLGENVGNSAVRQIKVKADARRPLKPGEPEMRTLGKVTPDLKVGQTYLLALKRFPNKKDEYYLPGSLTHFRAVTEKTRELVDYVEKLADVEKWPWGKADKGLQLAVVACHPELRVRKTTVGQRPMIVDDRAVGDVMVALRNTTQKPIMVNVYPSDRLLSLFYASEGEELRKHDLAEPRRREPFLRPKHMRVITPGEISFIHPRGQDHFPVSVSLDVIIQPGKVRLVAQYESKRDLPPEKGVRPWKGKLRSGEATVELKRPPKRPLKRPP